MPALLLAVLLTTASAASAQTPQQSDIEDIFAPYADTVPLSAFIDPWKFTGPIPVDTAVLAWIRINGWQIDATISTQPGGPDYIVPNLSFDVAAGLVDYPKLPEDYKTFDFVLTCPAVKNHFLSGPSAIVTHWDASVKRGQQREGANDAIQVFDTIGLKPSGQAYPAEAGGKTLADYIELCTGQTGAGSKFNTMQYALFSDGSGMFNDPFIRPSYERYIAENWSPHGATPYVCVWKSDLFRSRYGVPIVHRNERSAFTASGTAGVLTNAPVVQLVHGIVVRFSEPSYDPAGNEESLATLLLPPFWQPPAAGGQPPYKTLLFSYYGLNGTVLSHASLPVYDAIGTLWNKGITGAVAAMWNGGGSGVTQSKQESSFYAVEALLDIVQDEAGGDPEQVVITGGSRGGTAALSIASNPLNLKYTVQYVVAETPVVNIGRLAPDFGNPTYQLIQSTMQDLTGQCNGWLQDVMHDHPVTLEPDSITSADLAQFVLVGETNDYIVNTTLVNDSDRFVQGLRAENPRGVLLRAGTHDFSKPFTLIADYYEKLKAYGIPVRFELAYRFGHTYADDPAVNEALLLEELINPGSFTFPEGLHHYRRRNDQCFNEWAHLDLGGQPQPIIVEAPLTMTQGEKATWTFTGEPGSTYELWFREIDMNLWVQHKIAQPVVLRDGTIAPFFRVRVGSLPPAANPGVELSTEIWNSFWDDFWNDFAQTLGPSLAWRTFVHGIIYDDGNGPVWIGLDANASPTTGDWSSTTFLPASTVPQLGTNAFQGVSDNSRTSGLSSEILYYDPDTACKDGLQLFP